jgi:hypothetical protein
MLHTLTLSLTSQKYFLVKILKIPFCDLRNTFYLGQFFILYSFVYTRIKIAQLASEELSQLAQLSLVP